MNRASFARFDWALMASALFLVGLGVISMISTVGEGSRTAIYGQIAFACIGTLIALTLASVEYRSLSSYASFFYVASLVALILVLVIGVERNNAQSWFALGSFTLQPSEPAKLAFILFVASYFSRSSWHRLRHVVVSGLMLLPFILLIMRQPDFGTSLTLVATWIIMLLGLNLPKRDLTIVVGGALLVSAIFVAALLFFVSPNNYQARRIRVFPDHLTLSGTLHSDIGYQVDQSLIAIGAGGATGAGLGKGTQTHLGFLPAAQTDFIFAAIAEELGLLGIFLLLVLYGVLLTRILYAAKHSMDPFGHFVCLGVFGMLVFHLLENAGMNLGLVPVTGVPLSLVSAGGSHLVTVLAGIGIIESVAIRSQRIKY